MPGPLALAILAGLATQVLWNSLSETKRRKVKEFVKEIGKQMQEQQSRQALNSAQQPPHQLPAPNGQALAKRSLPESQPKETVPKTEVDSRWRSIARHPAIILILGKRGSGKSALGYRLLELLRFVAQPYVVGVPSTGRRFLPDWIGIVPKIEDLPSKAVALIDEAYLAFHARASGTSQAIAMSQLLNLSRQRQQTLIFVSQEARQVDLNIASSANLVVFKDLGILQLEFDRPELAKLATRARQVLSTVQGDRQKWAYVYAPDADFMGLLENQLPSFWKPSLSNVFAREEVPSQVSRPKKMTPQEKAQRALEMSESGLTYSEISIRLGVSKATVVNYLKGYPYK